MGDAVVFWARVAGGQDYVNAVCFVVFRGEEYERACGLTRCFLLKAVLAGAASGAAAARSLDRCRDGGPSRVAQPVLDAADSENGEEDALSPTEED